MKNNVVFPGINADLASIEQALPLDKRMARMPTETELKADVGFVPTSKDMRHFIEEICRIRPCPYPVDDDEAHPIKHQPHHNTNRM